MSRLPFVLLAIVAAAVLAGCAEDAKRFKIELYTDEQVSVDDPVYVDGVVAGHVISLLGDQAPLAEISLLGDEVLDRLRPGVYRDSQRGRINIQTHKAKLESAPLHEGELISSGGLIVHWSDHQTLSVAAVAIIAMLVLVFAFKVFFKAFLIVLTLGLSVALAWVTYPIGVPYVERLYTQTDSSMVEVSGEAAPSSQLSSGGSKAEDQFRQLLVNRPDPFVVAFGALAFCYFVMLTFVLGRVLGSLGRKI